MTPALAPIDRTSLPGPPQELDGMAPAGERGRSVRGGIGCYLAQPVAGGSCIEVGKLPVPI